MEFVELVNPDDCPDRANCVNSTERHGPDDGVDDSAYLGVLVDRADGTDKLNNGFGRDDCADKKKIRKDRRFRRGP